MRLHMRHLPPERQEELVHQAHAIGPFRTATFRQRRVSGAMSAVPGERRHVGGAG